MDIPVQSIEFDFPTYSESDTESPGLTFLFTGIAMMCMKAIRVHSHDVYEGNSRKGLKSLSSSKRTKPVDKIIGRKYSV